MGNTIVALSLYISTLSIACVTLGIIFKNWYEYGQKGQISTRMFMAISNGSMVCYLFVLVTRLSIKSFFFMEQLDGWHTVMSLLLLVAFLAWLKLFLE